MKRRMAMAMAAMYTVSCLSGCGPAADGNVAQAGNEGGEAGVVQTGTTADPIDVAARKYTGRQVRERR